MSSYKETKELKTSVCRLYLEKFGIGVTTTDMKMSPTKTTAMHTNTTKTTKSKTNKTDMSVRQVHRFLEETKKEFWREKKYIIKIY